MMNENEMNPRSTDTVLVTSIEVEPTSRAMNIGDSNFLFATVYPSNATNKTVRWSSDNTYVATVDQNSGLVMVNGNGVAFITATACDGSGVRCCVQKLSADNQSIAFE